MGLSAHHLLFERTAWTSRNDAIALRTTHSLIPRIDRDIHSELHDLCPPVPLLGSQALRMTLNEFEPEGNTFVDIDKLLVAIEASNNTRFAHDIDKQLSYLAIEALELQRNFLRGVL